MKTLALFDFDGTITTRDSFAAFLPFAVGWPRFLIGISLLSPVLTGYILKFISNSTAKQVVFRHFFKDWTFERFNECCNNFSIQQLPGLIRPHALERLQWHREQGHEMCIVSASFENYLKPWAASQRCTLLATQVDVSTGKLTGQFASDNCFGSQKVERIREHYDISIFQTIYAYGDSRGDREMLGLATEKYYHWKKIEDIRSIQ
jgi:HAD superfamily hydrolase (TIGR01490 family)